MGQMKKIPSSFLSVLIHPSGEDGSRPWQAGLYLSLSALSLQEFVSSLGVEEVF